MLGIAAGKGTASRREGAGVDHGDEHSNGRPPRDEPLPNISAGETETPSPNDSHVTDSGPSAGSESPTLPAHRAAEAPSATGAQAAPHAYSAEDEVTQPMGAVHVTPRPAARTEPLAPGARLGAYHILRTLRAAPGETVYLAGEVAPDNGDEPPEMARNGATDDPSAPHYVAYVTLIERAAGALRGPAQRIATELRHPRLLPVRAAFTSGAHDYMAVETLLTSDGSPAATVADGARLQPAAALTATAGIADALAYLHRNSIAHLHVAPDALLVYEGRTYLGGLESAEYVGALLDGADALFTRDANYLARTLGALVGLAEQPTPDESPVQRSIRQIVAQGEVVGFAGPAEIASACTGVLQTLDSTILHLNVDQPQQRLQVWIAAATSVGMVRAENQDAYATFVCDVRDDVGGQAPFSVFLVADGMGGEARGEIASRIAARLVSAETLRLYVLPRLAAPGYITGAPVGMGLTGKPLVPETDADATHTETANGAGSNSAGDHPEQSEVTRALRAALAQAVGAANRQVRELANQLGAATGTTITAIATHGAEAVVAHLGDSRAYLLRGELLAQLTEDHSVLARLQAIDHPLLNDPDVYVPRNMLYRSLGQEDDPGPDLFDVTITAGDRLLLCSDGLWEGIEAEAFASILAGSATPQECAEQLVTLANAAGGHDNSTAVVAFITAPSDDSAAAARADRATTDASATDDQTPNGDFGAETLAPHGRPAYDALASQEEA